MKWERLIRITRCHIVESIMSQYCGWQSRSGVVRYLKFREPYTVEPSACRHANKTGMIVINKKSWPVPGCGQVLLGLSRGEPGLGAQLSGRNPHARGSGD
jgi:hypothetical protein